LQGDEYNEIHFLQDGDRMELFDIFISFISLTILEVVLGIDNLVFLAIVTQRLPKHLQSRARRMGLTFAWVTRLLLLASALWLTKQVRPLFHIFELGFSWRDIFLIAGGMFLLVKATQEIHTEMEPVDLQEQIIPRYASFTMVIIQVAVLDIVFSLDSVLTAIGLTQRFWLMASAITIAIIAMIFASEPLSRFVEKHPTIKMLALSFLMLIGTILIAEGFQTHVPRGYIYFAMGFSLSVEILNEVRRRRRKESN
jgi:predicted tellurium resistance membrane protein TerC